MYLSYWCPFFDNVATITSIKNSIKSLKTFSKKDIKIDLINFFDEWKALKNNFDKKYKINLINIYNHKLLDLLPKKSFLKSRISYIIIFFLSAVPLYKYLKNKKPDFLVIHLVTSLPLFLLILFNFKTRFVLRISGLPKMNFLRTFFWRIAGRKIYRITVPTIDTKLDLQKLNIFHNDKIFLLRDPVFSVKELCDLKKEKTNNKFEKYFLAVGRLTQQKNHKILIEGFAKYLEKKNSEDKLIIIGEGEKRDELLKLIKKNNAEDNIFLFGYKKNPYKYINRAKCVISTSLWEDPGFVMIEAAALKKIVISSDCKNGPKEFLSNNAGYLFKNDNVNDLIKAIESFSDDEKDNKILNKKKLRAIKNSKKFTIYSHYKSFVDILN